MATCVSRTRTVVEHPGSPWSIWSPLTRAIYLQVGCLWGGRGRPSTASGPAARNRKQLQRCHVRVRHGDHASAHRARRRRRLCQARTHPDQDAPELPGPWKGTEPKVPAAFTQGRTETTLVRTAFAEEAVYVNHGRILRRTHRSFPVLPKAPHRKYLQHSLGPGNHRQPALPSVAQQDNNCL